MRRRGSVTLTISGRSRTVSLDPRGDRPCSPVRGSQPPSEPNIGCSISLDKISADRATVRSAGPWSAAHKWRPTLVGLSGRAAMISRSENPIASPPALRTTSRTGQATLTTPNLRWASPGPSDKTEGKGRVRDLRCGCAMPSSVVATTVERQRRSWMVRSSRSSGAGEVAGVSLSPTGDTPE